MGNGNEVGLTEGQREGSNLVGVAGELGDDLLRGDGSGGSVHDGTVIVDLLDLHTVRERLNVKLAKEDGLRVGDLLTLGAHLVVLGDFNLTLHNLGGDGQSMEERNLRGVQTGGTSGNGDVEGSDDTDSSGSGLSVTLKDGDKLKDGLVREDQTDLFSAQVGQSIELGKGSPALSGLEIGVRLLGLSKSDLDGLSDQGVLANNHDTLLSFSEGNSGLLDLEGRDVVELNQNDLLVGGEQVEELGNGVSLLLGLGSVTHYVCCMIFKKKRWSL
mmetsp:Transcript_26372/g.37006  ORF Transcript_26372/g.37006 Transcript_26372/m.37006 type:complete len:272 (+) Transcript_26372:778-1593(+)